ncbi:hypothetical protein [Mycolicibacterium mengxianglii]|uniref:hypothetical protein n=1 Tax=Mycolicibacterium mengxianglii TaxID=2736649 RepID=UPI0018D07808|nr:hypothetical protein [Mycolicibacterium mengxianglii]
MSGKHHEVPEFDRAPHPHSTVVKSAKRPSTGTILATATTALAFVGFSAAVLVAHADADPATGQPAPSAYTAPQPQPLSQEGTVVAVTSNSITARSADGFTQTYRVTPDTTAVTSTGGASFNGAPTPEAAPFSVNDEVAIQATMTAGLATATAVADSAVVGGHGMPMDSM